MALEKAVEPVSSLPPAIAAQMAKAQEMMDKSVEVATIASKEPWSEYTLEDGTVIRLRLVLVQARKVKDEKDEKGNPQYALQLSPLFLIEPAPASSVKEPS